MQIWVDADACPRAIREIVFRAAERLQVSTTLVANQYLKPPPSKVIRAISVPGGFDEADNAILERMEAGDLVVTADVPLADGVVSRGGVALNPRGRLYTAENVKDHLARRDIREELRSTGAVSGGPEALGKRDLQAFANALDRYLAQNA